MLVERDDALDADQDAVVPVLPVVEHLVADVCALAVAAVWELCLNIVIDKCID